jgi:hypothetical protein
VNALRSLLLGETWTLPLGVAVLAVLSVAADHAGLDWWPDAAGPLLLSTTTVLVVMTVWRTSRP